MSIFDLLFAVLFLAGATTLAMAGIAALRGRRSRAAVLLRRLGIGAALYLGAVILVSLLTPQRYVPRGQDQCSDDWCIAVEAITRDTVPEGARYEVTFRLSSRAGRITQRERFVVAYLRDAAGRRHDPMRDAGAVPFDTLLGPGEKVTATRRFLLADPEEIMGVVIAREGGGRFPGCCIIGDEGSLVHRRTIVRPG